jgi:hypothetical protein
MYILLIKILNKQRLTDSYKIIAVPELSAEIDAQTAPHLLNFIALCKERMKGSSCETFPPQPVTGGGALTFADKNQKIAAAKAELAEII